MEHRKCVTITSISDQLGSNGCSGVEQRNIKCNLKIVPGRDSPQLHQCCKTYFSLNSPEHRASLSEIYNREKVGQLC